MDGLNRTSVGLKLNILDADSGAKVEPQSNQRGIETSLEEDVEMLERSSLNRTSVGLKQACCNAYSYASC